MTVSYTQPWIGNYRRERPFANTLGRENSRTRNSVKLAAPLAWNMHYTRGIHIKIETAQARPTIEVVRILDKACMVRLRSQAVIFILLKWFKLILIIF